MAEHAITHIMIGVLIELLVWFVTGNVYAGAVAASGFYTGRELWQYYVLGKRHAGGFDWAGFVPVSVVVWAIAVVGR